jgi:hypothetical protein
VTTAGSVAEQDLPRAWKKVDKTKITKWLKKA